MKELCGLRWHCCGAPCARPLNHRGKCLCAVELKYVEGRVAPEGVRLVGIWQVES